MDQENKKGIDTNLNDSFENNELFIFALSMNSIQLIVKLFNIIHT